MVPRLPTEVCEGVIDAVYDSRIRYLRSNYDTLRSCALVCRAWRPRAQVMLFRRIALKDVASLHEFSALLDITPHFAGYVRDLGLFGYTHHTPQSLVALFPSVLHGKLPNLRDIHIVCQPAPAAGSKLPVEKIALVPKPDAPASLSLPLHQRFPSLLATFANVTGLHLTNISFPSFADFGRVLSRFVKLRVLRCHNVGWNVLGNTPKCMVSPPCPSRFLPELAHLKVRI